jgi:hypothetical protein
VPIRLVVANLAANQVPNRRFAEAESQSSAAEGTTRQILSPAVTFGEVSMAAARKSKDMNLI